MFTIKKLIILLIVCGGIKPLFSQEIHIGKRITVHSNILDDNRPINIYLPSSYYKQPIQKYPVLYILDGDYNFRYVSGLIELQSEISEDLPEMIIVGISGKGTKQYRKNCKPNFDVNDKGNANQMLLFIEKELIPFINKKYNTNAFKILSGHSVGGIFTTYAAITKPSLFNHYIAISPALWWENKAIEKYAKSILTKDNSLKPSIYISLADEKGMKVQSFLKTTTNNLLTNIYFNMLLIIVTFILVILLFKKQKVKKYFAFLIILTVGLCSFYFMYNYYPSNVNIKFRKFSNENHNSVGSPTYKWALRTIFKDWKVENNYFNNTNELKNHFNSTREIYKENFSISKNTLANTVFYILNKNEEELNKMQGFIANNYPNLLSYYKSLRIELLIKNNENNKVKEYIEINNIIDSKSIYLQIVLTKYYKEIKKKDKAKIVLEKLLKNVTQKHLRQWELNEIIELKTEIDTM